VTLSQSGPQVFGGNITVPILFTALVDTGAQKTMISTNVATTLGLLPQGQIPIQGVGPNVTYHNAYLFHVGFMIPINHPPPPPGQITAAVFIHEDVIWGAELTSPVGFVVLLGMDVLSTGALIVGADGRFSFSF
jgi:hypothetical protein